MARALSPDFPHTPQDNFRYECAAEVERSTVYEKEHLTGRIGSRFAVEAKPGTYRSNMGREFAEAVWQDLPIQLAANERRMAVSLEGIEARFDFRKDPKGDIAFITIDSTQISESKTHDLRTSKVAEAAHKLGAKLEAEIRLNESARWVNGEQPQGVLSTGNRFKVSCTRVK